MCNPIKLLMNQNIDVSHNVSREARTQTPFHYYNKDLLKLLAIKCLYSQPYQ